MKHIDIAEILKDSSFVGKEVTVCGWVRTSRDSKNMAFIELNDGTSLKHLQIVIDKSVLSDISEFLKLGTSLKVEGKVVGQVRGEKIIVFKYKSKKNYRRKQGHRQPYTKVEITKIG